MLCKYVRELRQLRNECIAVLWDDGRSERVTMGVAEVGTSVRICDKYLYEFERFF